MLNLMNSLKEEDRWMIGKGVGAADADKAITGTELEEEYLMFVDGGRAKA